MTGLIIGRTNRGAAILSPRFANRHGLITGATGSGKTVSVARLIQSLSEVGTPCLVFDAKGDLSGMAAPGRGDALAARFVDPFGRCGRHAPMSFATMGADVTARALGLTFAQSGVVDVAFEFSRQRRVALATPDDLRAVLARLERGEGRAIGHVNSASAAVVRRALLRLDGQAFAAHAYDVADLSQWRGLAGLVTVVDARRLSRSPALYGAMVAMILGELFDRLPDVGDLPRPKLAVFVDESHLVFDDIEPALSRRLESIVRLIRSRGVALFFASQSPADIPPIIGAQLANRIQHAMRAATPREQAGVRAAAESMPAAPGVDVAGAIGRLAPGQALVSLVGADGAPSLASIARIDAPTCRLGALTDSERAAFALAPAAPRLSSRDAETIAMGRRALLLIGLPVVASIAFFVFQVGFRDAVSISVVALILYALRRFVPLLLLAFGLSRHRHHHHHHH